MSDLSSQIAEAIKTVGRAMTAAEICEALGRGDKKPINRVLYSGGFQQEHVPGDPKGPPRWVLAGPAEPPTGEGLTGASEGLAGAGPAAGLVRPPFPPLTETDAKEGELLVVGNPLSGEQLPTFIALLRGAKSLRLFDGPLAAQLGGWKQFIPVELEVAAPPATWEEMLGACRDQAGDHILVCTSKPSGSLETHLLAAFELANKKIYGAGGPEPLA